MIGFGNPLLDGDQSDLVYGAYFKQDAALAREQQGCAVMSAPRTASLRGLPRGVGPMAQLGSLANVGQVRLQMPLPETADELCAVARTLKADVGEIRLSARATEREIKALSASGALAHYHIVHFATHGALAGLLSANSEPGLILTPPAEATEVDDGYLSASEFAGLKLDADWVILSACNTAGGASLPEADKTQQAPRPSADWPAREIGRLWRLAITFRRPTMYLRSSPCRSAAMELTVVPIVKPDTANFIFGQSHFIKTVEDLHEALVGAVPGIRFGLAFCEASGKRLVRWSGNDEAALALARDNVLAIGAGHTFLIFLGDGFFPVNVLAAVRAVPEVCRIYCATANPTQVIVAQTELGRGVLGVVDGASPLGVEADADIAWRKDLLRKIGYKL